MRMTLLSTINRHYRLPLEVLAASVLRVKQPATEVEWYIFTDEDVQDWTGWLNALHTHYVGRQVRFVLEHLPELTGTVLPLWGRARPIMYARLLAPGLLARRCPRVLYLDADMLALQPLEEVWTTELESCVCACCRDLTVPTVASGMAIRHHAELGLPRKTPYFNAGVMLIDTAKWQAEAVGERAFAYLARYAATLNLFDQEALNAVLVGRWQPLSCRWNLIASVAGRRFFNPDPDLRDDYAASVRAPGILHYAGTLKPWRNPYLSGPWYSPYRTAVSWIHPAYGYEPALTHWAQACYDARLRDSLYHFEHAIWQIRRGF